MTVLGITLLIFVMLGLYVHQDFVKGSDLKIYIYGQRLTNHVADNINTINTVADGHSTIFKLPEYLVGTRRYNVNFYKNESTAYIMGSTFTSGRPLVYSSPITSNNIKCLMPQCDNTCNQSSDHICIEVNNSLDIRLSKHIGAIYIVPTHNIIQDDLKRFASPYDGKTDIDPNLIPEFTWEVADTDNKWNMIYIWRNTNDDSITLALSMNLTNMDRSLIDITRLMGDVVSVQSNDILPDIEANLAGEPELDFDQDGPWDVDGVSIKFSGGFTACLNPVLNYMPTQDWMFMSSDGNHIILDKEEEICITYP